MVVKKHSQSPLSVKIAPDVREWLKARAADGYRSMSAQVVLILDAAWAAERDLRDEKNAQK